MQVLPPSSTGGPSRLFIMRPVATTLLMVAILPRRDYRLSCPARFGAAGSGLSTIQVVTLYPVPARMS